MIRLILFLMVSVIMAGGTSMAENLSTCPVDTVPIQIVGGAGRGEVSSLSEAKITDFPPGFTAFVTTVTKHVAAKLAQEKLCLDSAESKENSLLQFVSWPIDAGPLALVPELEARSSCGCRISSPWIDLIIEREPVPSVRAIARYNERQLLVDQALLTGMLNVSTGVAMPLERSELDRYADLEYAPTEIYHQPSVKPIEERVPPDILWLLRRAWQGACGRFSGPAGASIRKAMEMAAESYTEIVIVLIDRCLTSDGTHIQYNSILDLADLISLEQYKIVTPIIEMPENGQ